MGRVLREHQVEAVDAAVAALRCEDRTTLVAPPGAGKTVIMAEVSRLKVPEGRVLTAVPTIQLAAQQAAELNAWKPRRTVVLCSDKQALKLRTIDAEATVTTDAEGLFRAMRQHKDLNVISTYASLETVQYAHSHWGAPAWNMLMVDEAHNTTGSLDKARAVVHKDAYIPAYRRLYATATPKVFGFKGENMASMDDPSLFGRVCYRMKFEEAIDRRILSDYSFEMPIIAFNRVPVRERILYEDEDGEIDEFSWVMALELLKWAKKEKPGKAISFHFRTADADALSRAVRLALLLKAKDPSLVHDVFSGSIHSKLSMAQRGELLETLRTSDQEFAHLANVAVLGEGIDVPAIKGVAFCFATESMVRIVQAVGRGLRLHGPDGTKAKIFNPLFIHRFAAPHTHQIAEAYHNWFGVVRALQAYDDRFTGEAFTGHFDPDIRNRFRKHMNRAPDISVPRTEAPHDWDKVISEKYGIEPPQAVH